MAEKDNGSSSVPDDLQRWTAGRKAAVVLDLIKGKATAADVARQHGLTVAEVETWLERFMEGGKEFLRAVPRDSEARFESEKRDLHAKIGEQALQIDALKKVSRMLEAQRQSP
ncbi:MAG: DUF1153 domain-containing protein [Phycisphaerales bacterium]